MQMTMRITSADADGNEEAVKHENVCAFENSYGSAHDKAQADATADAEFEA